MGKQCIHWPHKKADVTRLYMKKPFRHKPHKKAGVTPVVYENSRNVSGCKRSCCSFTDPLPAAATAFMKLYGLNNIYAGSVPVQK
jgi:hypothetical protein